MKNLLKEWHIISPRIQERQQVFLLCDFDGTLTPIVSRPELAELAPGMRNLLMELNYREGIKLGIISGRNLDDLRNKVAIPDLVYAGNHGMEISGPGVNYTVPLPMKTYEVLRAISVMLREQLGNINGIVIEDKGLTLSIHYRLVPEDKHWMIRDIVHSISRRMGTSEIVKISYGKKVFEIRPGIAWDKGNAVSLITDLLIKERSSTNFLPIYLGDDITDEDGFRAVNQVDDGISVVIGEARNTSLARYCLESTADVEEFLARLLIIVSSKSH